MKIYQIIIITLFIYGGFQEDSIEINNPDQSVAGPKLIDITTNLNVPNKRLPLLLDDRDTIVLQFRSNGTTLAWIDFGGFSEKNLIVKYIDRSDYPEFAKKTNVYFGYSENRDDFFVSVDNHDRPVEHKVMDYPLRYQSEGPVWESEHIAFRSYFDARNGKDIFGKTRPSIRADKIGYREDYHQLQDWGMDVLKVGNSLGAGALAILKNDSVYRLGETATSKFEIKENGPLATTFTLSYNGWEVADQTYGLEETISIFAGQKWYRSVVRLTGGDASDTLVTGIVTLKNPTINESASDNMRAIYTHGEQSENNDALGMALIVPDTNYTGSKDAPTSGEGVITTRMIYLQPVNGEYVFYFYSEWEGADASFAEESKFAAAVNKQMEVLSSQLFY